MSVKKDIIPDLLYSAGFQVADTNRNGDPFRLLVIRNRDKSIRWAWPAHLSEPLFLKFYNTSGLKAKMYAALICLIFRLRIQRFVFKARKINFQYPFKRSRITGPLGNWALFTGTIGPNRKGQIYVKKNNKSQFVKIGLSYRSKALLRHEANILNLLAAQSFQYIKLPKVLETVKGAQAQSDLQGKGRRPGKYTALHAQTLKELNQLNSESRPLGDIPAWNLAKIQLKKLSTINDPRLPKGIIRKVQSLMDMQDPQQQIMVGFSHGDFTTWNMLVQGKKLYLYDWELADMVRPNGFDTFHYVIQRGILMERREWKDIEATLMQIFQNPLLSPLNEEERKNWRQYLNLYLVLNISYYLSLYVEQAEWHPQIKWLLKTWEMALTSSLAERKSHRQLLLIDLFNFLHDQSYVALKFPDILPEALSKNADVDLCLNRKLVRPIRLFLDGHPLVSRIDKNPKSFMHTYRIHCKNGEMLALDLIWKLKRKWTVILDVHALLAGSTMNSFGIKKPDPVQEARYIGLFYMLNKAPIPEKYKAHGAYLSDHEREQDHILKTYFRRGIADLKNLQRLLCLEKENKGIQGIQNKLSYLWDCLRSLLTGGGMVVTFSGVDGAGKSTLIELLRERIEKQMRKPVVVLRHRPSIFPILNAGRVGRKKAELDVLQHLPRKGTNRSLISSFFRFLYYYIDYLIGQYWVKFFYTNRGYVVLYDRYYFDFIKDAKRSNIELPQKILKLGYSFLMKPRHNFLLFADAEQILLRKQELDKSTINQLTFGYKTLFHGLAKSSTKGMYYQLENFRLEETLDKVYSTIAS